MQIGLVRAGMMTLLLGVGHFALGATVSHHALLLANHSRTPSPHVTRVHLRHPSPVLTVQWQSATTGWLLTEDGNIWITHDGGRVWQNTRLETAAPAWHTWVTHFGAPRRVAWATQIVQPAPNTLAVAMPGPGPDQVTLWSTTDAGQRWRQTRLARAIADGVSQVLLTASQTTQVQCWVTSVIGANDERLAGWAVPLAGGSPSRLWAGITPTVTGLTFFTDQTEIRTGISLVQNRAVLARTTTGGRAWQSVPLALPPGAWYPWVEPPAAIRHRPLMAVLPVVLQPAPGMPGPERIAWYRTTTGGRRWRGLPRAPIVPPAPVTALFQSWPSTDDGWVIVNHALSVTTTAGRLWARRSLPPGTPQDLYAINATQATVVLQRRTTLAIWRTTSGGVTWHAVAVFTST